MSLDKLTNAQLEELIALADRGADSYVRLRKIFYAKNVQQDSKAAYQTVKQQLNEQFNDWSAEPFDQTVSKHKPHRFAKVLQVVNSFWGTFNTPFGLYWGLTEFTISAMVVSTVIFAGIATGGAVLLGIVVGGLYLYKTNRDEKKAARELQLQQIKLYCLGIQNKRKNKALSDLGIDTEKTVNVINDTAPSLLQQLSQHTTTPQKVKSIKKTRQGKFFPKLTHDGVWSPGTIAIDAFGTASDNTWAIVSIIALIGLLSASVVSSGLILALIILTGVVLAIGMIIASRMELNREKQRKQAQTDMQTQIEEARSETKRLIQIEHQHLRKQLNFMASQNLQETPILDSENINKTVSEKLKTHYSQLTPEQEQAIRFTRVEKTVQFSGYFVSVFTTGFSVFWQLSCASFSAAIMNTLLVASIATGTALVLGLVVGGLYLYKMRREEKQAIKEQQQLNLKLACEKENTQQANYAIAKQITLLRNLLINNKIGDFHVNLICDLAKQAKQKELLIQLQYLGITPLAQNTPEILNTHLLTSIHDVISNQDRASTAPPRTFGNTLRAIGKRMIEDKVWGPATIGLAMFGAGFGTVWGATSIMAEIGLLAAVVATGGGVLLLAIGVGLALGIIIASLHYLSLHKEEQREATKTNTENQITEQQRQQQELAQIETCLLQVQVKLTERPLPAIAQQQITPLFHHTETTVITTVAWNEVPGSNYHNTINKI